MKVIPSFFASKVDTDDNDLGHEEKETNCKNYVVNTPNRRGHDNFFSIATLLNLLSVFQYF